MLCLWGTETLIMGLILRVRLPRCYAGIDHQQDFVQEKLVLVRCGMGRYICADGGPF